MHTGSQFPRHRSYRNTCSHVLGMRLVYLLVELVQLIILADCTPSRLNQQTAHPWIPGMLINKRTESLSSSLLSTN